MPVVNACPGCGQVTAERGVYHAACWEFKQAQDEAYASGNPDGEAR